MTELDEQRSSRRVWIFAAVIALALHAGGAALAIAHLQADEGDGFLGAQGLEIGLELTSSATEVLDMPVGPDSEAQQASQATPEQKAVEKETDLPKEVATETEDPDRIVTQTDPKKPEKEEPEPAAVKTAAAPDQAAAEAAAQQAIENARVTEKSTVVNQGLGKDRQKLTADWGRKISAYFELHKKYPPDKRKVATVKLALVLNRLGNVVSVNVAESSGDTAFDDAAISMVRRSDPVPRPPAGLTDDQFSFTLPVNFTKPK